MFAILMSPGDGATSGTHFDMFGSRVPYATTTPALRARHEWGYGRQHLALAFRLRVADGIDIIEHHQGRRRGGKGNADRVRQRRHLQGQQTLAVQLRLSRSPAKREEEAARQKD